MSFYKNITPYIYIQTGKCGKQPSTVVCFLFKYIFVCLFLFFDGISCAAPGIDSDGVFLCERSAVFMKEVWRRGRFGSHQIYKVDVVFTAQRFSAERCVWSWHVLWAVLDMSAYFRVLQSCALLTWKLTSG